MRFPLAPRIAFLLLALAATACEDAEPPPAVGPVPARRGPPALTGRVLDAADEPVEGAEVKAQLAVGGGHRGWKEGISTRTDEQGEFVLDLAGELGLEVDAPVFLSVTKDGYVPNRNRINRYRPGIGLSVTVNLVDGGALAGRVVDEELAPVAGAIVYAIPPDRVGFERSDLVPSVLSDDAGRFRLSGLPVRELDVGVIANGRLLTIVGSFAVVPKADVEVGDIRLEPGETIEGVVRTPAGAPVEGAEVRAYQNPAYKNFVVLGRAAVAEGGGVADTDADGRFRFNGLRAGRYDLLAKAMGHRSVDALVRDVATGRDDVVLLLDPEARVELQIYDAATVRPVPEFTVAVTPLGDPFASVKLEEAKSIHGIYRFPVSRGVSYRVEVSAEGYEVVVKRVDVTEDGPGIVKIAMIRR